MSRIVLTPVSGSLFHTTRRIVTFSGTAYVIPRSWHSSTSYFSFRPTVLPQTSQMSPRASFGLPQRGHSTSCSPYGSATSVWPQLTQGLRRWCRPASRPHLHSQLPIEYSMNSSDEFSRKSEIGNKDLKTDWRAGALAPRGSRFICRNRSYDFFWISIRFGIGMVVLIFEKSMRSRYTFLGRLYMLLKPSALGARRTALDRIQGKRTNRPGGRGRRS